MQAVHCIGWWPVTIGRLRENDAPPTAMNSDSPPAARSAADTRNLKWEYTPLLYSYERGSMDRKFPEA